MDTPRPGFRQEEKKNYLFELSLYVDKYNVYAFLFFLILKNPLLIT